MIPWLRHAGMSCNTIQLGQSTENLRQITDIASEIIFDPFVEGFRLSINLGVVGSTKGQLNLL